MNQTNVDQSLNLAGYFVAAMPTISDSAFTRSLVYICSHNDQGAFGLIINKPMPLDLAFLCPASDTRKIIGPKNYRTVYFGGPAQQNKGFVLHRRDESFWKKTIHINEELSLTSSGDIITSIAENNELKDFFIASGYSVWSKGDLEEEIMNNYWLVIPGNTSIIFDIPPQQRLNAAMNSVGITLSDLSPFVGNA